MFETKVRKPVVFWTFLVLGLLALVGCLVAGMRGEWPNAVAQLVVACVLLSLPVRLSR